MRITGLHATWVRVELAAPLHWALGVHAAIPRLLVEVRTDDGVSGVAETHAVPDATRLLAVAAEVLRGVDPLCTTTVHHRLRGLGALYETMIPPGLAAGIEIACLDAAGRALGVSVSDLLGGRVRDEIAVAAYVFPRGRGRAVAGGERTPEELAGRADELVATYGFRTIKLKAGTAPPADDLRALALIADRHPAAVLRLDPNAGWSVPDALRALEALAALGLPVEFVEDPVAGLEAMAHVRARSRIALATNMCVVAEEHLAPAVRAGAVDVVLADPHYWGGFAANRRMAAICTAFGIAVGMHSDNDLGLSTAAKLHLAATTPELTVAMDSHHPEHGTDLLQEPIPFADGAYRVPTGPGLGVDLDPDAVARHAIAETDL